MISNCIKKVFEGRNIEGFFLNIFNDCLNYFNNSNNEMLATKKDGTPLSKADLEIDKVICQSLKALPCSLPIISEERQFNKYDFLVDSYWLIDPIDGTSSFVAGKEEYTVNIALINQGIPELGFIAHPTQKKFWLGINNILKFFDRKRNKFSNIDKKKILNNNPTVITSRYLDDKTKDYLSLLKTKEIIRLSSSLKFCFVAEKKAEIYPRFSPIKKWDVAAGHAILRSIGGEILTKGCKEFNYKSKTEKTDAFIATYDMKWFKRNYKKLSTGFFL